MPIDPYSPCPGGLGKKVKFCCHDLVHELDKIDQMRAAEQRAACLEYVEKLDAKHPGRACLVTAKADLLRELGRGDEAGQAVKSLLGQQAANPVALAEAAILACDDDDVAAAGALLQQAFAVRPDPLPPKVVEALVRVGERLLVNGEILAARSHFALYLALVRQDENVMELFLRIDSTPSLSLLLKEDRPFLPAPADVAWQAEFETAMASVSRAAWGDAASRLTALAAGEASASPAVWHNLAVLRGWLGHNEAASKAWHRYASFDLAADDKIEAEALAQLLDPASDQVDLVMLTQPIHDIDRLTEILASDRRFRAVQVPLASDDPENPPPRAIYLLTDRPIPAADVTPEASALPKRLAQVMIFGRQTNREARLELIAERGTPLDEARAIIGEFSFGLLGPATEEVIEQTPLNQALLRSESPAAPGLSYEEQMRLALEQLEDVLLRRWPEMKVDALDGKTPRQMAASPDGAYKVSAAILNLELSAHGQSVEFDFNRLRRELGLSEPATIELGDRPLEEVPLVQLARLNMASLTDEQLSHLVRMAVSRGAMQALRLACLELVRRPETKEGINKASAFGQLAALSSDANQAIAYLDQARQAAEAAGQSTARWDLQEVNYRVQKQEPDQVMRIINHVAREHASEPGVSQALMGMMVQLGLMRPDGTMVRPPADEAAAGLSAPTAAAEPGKIWTPESARGGEKPSLWLPGS
jgi:hypothetical protein